MKYKFLSILSLIAALLCGTQVKAQQVPPTTSDSVATVFFIKNITPENLVKIYDALDRRAKGKVCVKISTGEKGNPNYLKPALNGDLVKGLHATIVECNTAYPGAREFDTEHRQVIIDHGFSSIAPVVILDSTGETSLPVLHGNRIKQAYVGKDWLNYDFTIVLSHFKGHAMAGFGGALKNMGIGLQCRNGKAWVHSAANSTNPEDLWKKGYKWPAQEDWLEVMTEAAGAVMDHAGNNILYINVANNISVDCDCSSHPSPAQISDIGIFASLDPVALDRACIDAVNNSPEHGKVHMQERIASRKGTHTLDYAEQIGLGTQKYVLIVIE